MNTQEEVRGNWNQLVGAVKSKYSEITGDDLAGLNGNIQKLAGLIQEKTGQAKEEVESFLRNAASTTANSVGKAAEVAAEYTNKAGESIRDGYNYAREATRDTYDAAGETVQKNPVESMAVVFGIGIVAGLIAGASLFSRR